MGLTSTHWGTYQPKVEQGRVTDMRPFSEDGDPSDIGKGFVDVLDAPSRITAPMVRKGWLERKGLVHLVSAAATVLLRWIGRRLLT